ncbi:hypothetical protein EAH89_17405 [Roseomonas nepalensis]|uniref:Uncharacterized protein n=1 Tax=Muricoccus nepalensis TaxID=1854500 RepID=A0A502FV20_9PROT|nr:hypothetical protein [Roseomonas nepalensis]TPG53294.1 hypothetical protein EAH89_17405 [Roseomonas nepalensis]
MEILGLAHSQPALAAQLQQALLTSLEMYLAEVDDPAARCTALQDACGRIAEHLSVAPLPCSGDDQWKHPALITAALYAATQQLQGQLADA